MATQERVPRAITPDQLVRRASAFLQGLGDDDPTSRRLAEAASTSVRFVVVDAPDRGWTLRLDRHPVEADPRIDERAEIEIRGTAERLHGLYTGERLLCLELLEGHLAYRGPVRKLLAVGPMLRALARERYVDDDARLS